MVGIYDVCWYIGIFNLFFKFFGNNKIIEMLFDIFVLGFGMIWLSGISVFKIWIDVVEWINKIGF